MVPVVKKSGVRICVDLERLNQKVRRERYMMPTMDDIIHKLHSSNIFSKPDATSSFWQIPLDEQSAELTTFITRFGRFCFKRHPFGITSSDVSCKASSLDWKYSKKERKEWKEIP